jgi:hypothetical protein
VVDASFSALSQSFHEPWTRTSTRTALREGVEADRLKEAAAAHEANLVGDFILGPLVEIARCDVM